MRSRRSTAIGFLLLVSGVILWLTRRDVAPRLDSPAVVAQIQRLNQLATVRYTVQKIVGMQENKVPVGLESILLVVQADVQAGVNLGLVKAGDVEIQSGGNVILHLPSAQILNVSINEKETKVWDRQKTWWTPWVPYSKDLEQRARVQGLESARQAALEMGILKQADRNAETAIRGLLQLLGVKSVTIIPASMS